MAASSVDQNSPCVMFGGGKRCELRHPDDLQRAADAREGFVISAGFFNAAKINLPHRAKTP